MQVIDKINQGRLGKVYFAVRGRDTWGWMMKREQLSPRCWRLSELSFNQKSEIDK